MKHAFSGIIHCVLHERHMRVHVIAAAYIIYFSIALGLSGTNLAVILLTCAAVMSLEAVNTAIEAVVDIISPEHSRLAKVAKDAAAGAVLISAVAAVAIAAAVFVPEHITYAIEQLLALNLRLWLPPVIFAPFAAAFVIRAR